MTTISDTAVATDVPSKEQAWLPASVLKVDHSYQRQLDHRRVKRLASNFDPDAIGTILVSRRKDGFYVIDGQHRVALFHEIGWSDQKLPALVHHGLSIEEEARLFRASNDSVSPGSFAIFRAELTEGGPEATAIDRVVRSLGLEVAQGGNTGGVQCVSALRRVYRHTGGETLYEVLSTIQSAWGNASTNFQADVITALALFYKRYNVYLDRDRLVKVLHKTTSTAVLAKAKQARIGTTGAGSVWAATLPEIIQTAYNTGLRNNRLPAWERRTNVREVWT